MADSAGDEDEPESPSLTAAASVHTRHARDAQAMDAFNLVAPWSPVWPAH